jgi:hypothetical protein
MRKPTYSEDNNGSLDKLSHKNHIEWLISFFQRFLEEERTELSQKAFRYSFGRYSWFGSSTFDFFDPLIAADMGAGFRTEESRWPSPHIIFRTSGNILLVFRFDRLPYGDTEGVALSHNVQAIGYVGASLEDLRACLQMGVDVVWLCGGEIILLPRGHEKILQAFVEKISRSAERALPNNVPKYKRHLNLNLVSEGLAFSYSTHPDVSLEKIAEMMAARLLPSILNDTIPRHRALIKALSMMARELGYYPLREYAMSYIRVDCVWLSPSGEVFAALEVETRGDIKKDIVSIWQTQPKLGIILGQMRSESVLLKYCQSEAIKNAPFPMMLVAMDICELVVVEKGIVLFRLPLAKEGTPFLPSQAETTGTSRTDSKEEEVRPVPRFQDPSEARDFAIEVLGATNVGFFDKNGYLEVKGSNGHMYYVFRRISAGSVGQKGEKKWLVFGIGTSFDRPGSTSPSEKFLGYDSLGFPIYTELVSVVLQIQENAMSMMDKGWCSTMLGPDDHYPATDKMLKKINKTVDERVERIYPICIYDPVTEEKTCYLQPVLPLD